MFAFTSSRSPQESLRKTQDRVPRDASRDTSHRRMRTEGHQRTLLPSQLAHARCRHFSLHMHAVAILAFICTLLPSQYMRAVTVSACGMHMLAVTSLSLRHEHCTLSPSQLTLSPSQLATYPCALSPSQHLYARCHRLRMP